MILNTGEYIHVIHRQLFPGDAWRHFVGTVESHEGANVRVKGYLFAKDSAGSQFVRREQLRTRIISLNDAVIGNIRPARGPIAHILYTQRPNRDVLVTDGTEWELDITHL